MDSGGGSGDEDDILSPELREQLGSGDGAELVLNKKSKKKKQDAAAPQEEPVVVSKSMQRKLDAIKKRKDNEAKRAQYLSDINQHKLSEAHQQLMVSARDQGQKHTAKWRLKMVIRRHKAGLALTDEERGLLTPYLDSQLQDSSDEDGDGDGGAPPLKKIRAAAPGPAAVGAVPAQPPAPAVPVSAPEPKPVAADLTPAPVVEPSDGLSVGERLMAQFRQIRTRVAADAANAVVQEEAPQEVDLAAEFAAKHKPYAAESKPTAMDLLMERHRAGGPAEGARAQGGSARRFFVDREDSIQLARMQLPVCAMEQEIVEAINNNDAVILCGETGSGKSTQVPQFLYEAGYCAEEGVRIGITQPRRVAASSTAMRVAVEMNCPIGGAGDDAGQEEGGDDDGDGRKAKRNKKRRRRAPLARARQLVGYQVRHDASTVTADTCIKYMTDGILLREVTADLLLRQYSAIILDEAHERNVNTDVLLGLLSRALVLRKAQAAKESTAFAAMTEEEREGYVSPLRPLKLIIMSATLRIDDFLNTRLFPPPLPFPPVIKVEARQYPVVPHFSKRTELKDYTRAAYKKVVQIHRKLPEGGVLVFLTGRREIMQMTNKLRKYFNKRHIGAPTEESQSEEARPEEGASLPGLWSQGDDAEEEDPRQAFDHSDSGTDSDSESDDFSDDEMPTRAEDTPGPTSGSGPETTGGAVDLERNALLQQLLMGGGIHSVAAEAVPGASSSSAAASPLHTIDAKGEGGENNTNDVNDANNASEEEEEEEERPRAALVLPLFAMLSAEQQARVFRPPPPGTRLIVIATNVAETSITIPGVKYVIDCGRYKEKVIQSASGISKYEVQWVSKASADQRMGRAGRTGPGHCYRLYSSAFYDQHMKAFQPPEILKTPLEDLLLQMRSLGIKDVEHFPFPTPPTASAVRIALDTLSCIAAVSEDAPRPGSALAALAGKAVPRPIAAITALGRMLAQFPIGARYAKMLVVAHRSTGLSARLACALVAALTERPPFISKRSSFHLVGEKRGHRSDSESDRSDAEREEQEEAAGLAFHPTSDPLARLRALGAYIHARGQAGAPLSGRVSNEKAAKKISQFCSKHSLHQPSLERALELARQLCGLYEQLLENGPQESRGDPMAGMAPPSAEEELALRQVLVTGLPDCVARRARAGAVTAGSRRQRLTAYFSCNPSVTKPLYIHPESCLYRKDPTANLPEFVVYGQLVENEMGTFTYMTSVSALEAAWLPELTRDCPLLRFSEPLQSPAPTYDAEADEVKCYVIPTYGIHCWELTPVKVSLAETCASGAGGAEPGPADLGALPGYRRQDEAVRWFARLLLEGAVLSDPMLRGLFTKAHVKLTLSTLTSLKVTKAGSQLLLQLAKANVMSVGQLTAKLKEKPLFLYEELQACLHTEARKQFRLQWTRFVQGL